MFAWAKIGAYVEIYSSSLVRADDSQTVYHLTVDGYRYPIASERAFLAHGYHWSDVVVVPAAEIAAMPIAGTITE